MRLEDKLYVCIKSQPGGMPLFALYIVFDDYRKGYVNQCLSILKQEKKIKSQYTHGYWGYRAT